MLMALGRTRRCATLATTCALGLLALAAPAQARPTYVSLTFDDASADQMAALPILADHGMHGTFYVISGEVGDAPYFMTWSQVGQVAAAGHEIGGHTVGHPDLTTLAPAAQQAEICDDRQALAARGYDPVSFAYPFAKWNATARAAVQTCGYSSGRGVGGAGCLPGCIPAESVPPADPFVLRTPPGHTSTTTLATVKGYVTNAVQNGGGWVILTLHNICNKCDSNSIRAQDLDALLDWIQTRASDGVSVKTVREVMALPPPAPPPNLLQNAGVEDGLSASGASCWLRTGYAGPSGGGHSALWAHTSDAHGGANAETVTIGTRADGDEKLVSVQDPVVTPPSIGSLTALTTGGTLAPATYFYRLTATSAGGETLPSGAATVSTTTTTSSVKLTWTAPAGATGYRVYRSTASGAETLLVSVGAVTTYTDTGALTPGTARPPTSNSASRSTSCSPPGIPGHVYQVSAWYETSADASVRMVAYYRDLDGAWQFWREQVIPAATAWTRVIWQTPPLPAGATAIGTGFSLRSVGTATVDDLTMGDLTP
jgi:peptidoglycan/xylan/chitin deacetylase (PgdA/CDA1 family)